MDRSILYNLEPIGIGTPYVESLSSYITRLAEAHCIYTGTIISKVYAPLLKKEYLLKITKRGGNGFFDSAIGINGFGKLAVEFVQLTDTFTGRSDLRSTTLINWSSILSNRGLFKKNKSWCPACYEDSKVNGKVAYDQLIWNFQHVASCLKHNIPLKDICEYCNGPIPVINRKSIPGYCPRCDCWLGSLSINRNTLRENKEGDLSDAFIIGDLLAKSNFDITNSSLFDSLNFYVNKSFDNSPTKAAKYFKIPKSTFSMWLAGENLPGFYYLVRMCKGLGVSIIGFLQKQQYVNDFYSTDRVEEIRERYDHEKIKITLDKLIENQEPISISSAAKLIGCDRKLLSKRYVVECNQIKENYNLHLQEKKKENTNKKARKLEGAFYSLVQQGTYPSRRRLEEVLGTGFLRENAIQMHWNELKRELYE
ncbi:TniQ family protein [Halalkalibacter urbisdiaboli]|uniref:TniQ family protein n=1 Tax=Halalkalibacter urbisdiaboli TaxID=1960589 RepID=UPI000B436774|nr:TniQ family protein [Halalkalibacter urbisdiaboli]